MAVDFVPHLPNAQMISRAIEDMRDCADIYLSYLRSRDQFLEQLAGPHLHAMRNSPRLTELQLDNPDPKLRIAALLLIRDYWPSRDRLTSACIRSAMSDSEAQVRGIAFHCVLRLMPTISDSTGFIRELVSALTDRPSSSIKGNTNLSSDPSVAREPRDSPVGRPDSIADNGNVLARLNAQQVNDMLASRQSTEKYLDSPLAELRCVAISLLTDHWAIDHNVAERCEHLLHTDPSAEVRAQAVVALSTWYDRTDNVRIGKLLAELIYDCAQPNNVRDAAYKGLFLVRGMPVTSWPSFRQPKGEYHFPEDVDWSFVDSFLPSK